jgi:non-heme chloroperoxidase
MPSLASSLLAVVIGVTAPTPARPLTWLTLSNGVTIRYMEQGDPNGIPIVMLHGYSDSWQSFARVLPAFPDRFRLIAVDLRGHGGSDRPPSRFGIADMADDVARLLVALDLERATLIGHSMGSFVAREAARRAGRRVHRLVLVGSAPRLLNEGTEQLFDLIASFGEQIPPEFIEEFQRSTFARPLPDDFVAGVMAASHALPPRVWREAAKGMRIWDDRRRLSQLRLPTLLVWGELDQVFTRVEQDALLDAIPGSRLISYAATGHAPHWEVPSAFVADVLGFMEEEQERR